MWDTSKPRPLGVAPPTTPADLARVLRRHVRLQRPHRMGRRRRPRNGIHHHVHAERQRRLYRRGRDVQRRRDVDARRRIDDAADLCGRDRSQLSSRRRERGDARRIGARDQRFRRSRGVACGGHAGRRRNLAASLVGVRRGVKRGGAIANRAANQAMLLALVVLLVLGGGLFLKYWMQPPTQPELAEGRGVVEKFLELVREDRTGRSVGRGHGRVQEHRRPRIVYAIGGQGGHFQGAAPLQLHAAGHGARAAANGVSFSIARREAGPRAGGLRRRRVESRPIDDAERRMNDNWLVWALLSAVFAALTALLSKAGLRGVDPDAAQVIRTAVVLAATGALVFATGTWRGISQFGGRTWAFLALAGLATAASWVCYFRGAGCGEGVASRGDRQAQRAPGGGRRGLALERAPRPDGMAGRRAHNGWRRSGESGSLAEGPPRCEAPR